MKLVQKRMCRKVRLYKILITFFVFAKKCKSVEDDESENEFL